MTPRRLAVVSAGLGQPSSTRLLADRLASAAERHLEDLGFEAVVTVIDLRDHAQDLANHLLTGFPAPGLRAAIDAVIDADGLIATSPIYSGSYSGLFKLFFDVLGRDGLAGRPVLVAATGGTARHSLALDHAFRPLFAYFGAAVVPTAVFAASEDWGNGGAPDEPSLVERVERGAAELARGIADGDGARRPDPFEEPTPFEQLLQAGAPRTRTDARGE
jgi:FMN reductase